MTSKEFMCTEGHIECDKKATYAQVGQETTMTKPVVQDLGKFPLTPLIFEKIEQVAKGKNKLYWTISDEDRQIWKEFQEFQFRNDRHYKTDEEELYRFELYKNTIQKVAELNADPGYGSATFGVNLFADMTPKEMSCNYTMTNCDRDATYTQVSEERTPPIDQVEDKLPKTSHD